MSLVSRIDVADCLARQAGLAPTGGIEDITGPEALGIHTIATRAAVVYERSIRVVALSPRDHRVEMAAADTDPWWAYAFSTMFSSIRGHRWSRVTDAVEQLTGRAPTAIDDPRGPLPTRQP